MSIKVSVIIPSYNPGKCITRCISSLAGQTLKSIEIICADAGSDDGTAQFLDNAAGKDPRIRLLTVKGASFGELANAGIDAAAGRFISVIRPGDMAEPDCLKSLYEVSSGMDMVMAGFYNTPARSEKENLIKLPARYTAISSFNPLLTFDTPLDQSEIFSINCAVGSAIISREFLKSNSIYYTETDAPLYHDLSFSFKVWACASHVRLLDNAFLHCGWHGSLKYVAQGISPAEAVFNEFDEIRYFIREAFAEDQNRIKVLQGIMMRIKFDSYLSCCQILPGTEYKDFIRKASAEFEDDAEREYADRKYFPSFDWNTFSTWVYDPEAFIEMLEKSRKPSLLNRIHNIFKGQK